MNHRIIKYLILGIFILTLIGITSIASAEWNYENVDVYPDVEGFVLNAGGGNYYNFTTWKDNIQEVQIGQMLDSLQRRGFYQFNFSRLIPLNATVLNVNLSFLVNNSNSTGDTFGISAMETNITNVNMTTNDSLYYYGFGTQGRVMTYIKDIDIFSPVGNPFYAYLLNTWKAAYTGLGDAAEYDGWWYKDTAYSGARGIRENIMRNISVDKDTFIIGLACYGVANDANIGTRLNYNTSCPSFHFVLNISWNISESNSSHLENNGSSVELSNNTICNINPDAVFSMSNPNASYSTYSVMLYDTVTSTWTEEWFQRGCLNGTQTVRLANASNFNRKYYWYVDILGNDTDPVIYHFTTEYAQTVNLSIKWENTSSDGYNSPINLSWNAFRNGSHRLIIHYANYSSTITYLDGDSWNDSDYTGIYPLYLDYVPLFYELRWNDTVTGTELYTQYTRILTGFAEDEGIGNFSNVSFYITPDMHIYGSVYAENNTFYLNDYLDGSLCRYLFDLDDQSGYFSGINSSNNFMTIWKNNDTEKLIIHQQFIGASGIINPVLIYGDVDYHVGVYPVAYPEIATYYEDIGQVLPDGRVDPAVVSFIVKPYETQLLKQIINKFFYSYSWYPNISYPSALYLYVNDESLNTTAMSFTLYNLSGAYLYSSNVSTYQNNFTYSTANSNQSYHIVLNVTYNGKLYYYIVDIWLFNLNTSSHDVTSFSTLLVTLFGNMPWTDDGGTSQNIVSWALMIFFCIIAVLFIASNNPILGFFGPGFGLLFVSGLLSGISIPTGVGGFLILMGFIWLLANKGVER